MFNMFEGPHKAARRRFPPLSAAPVVLSARDDPTEHVNAPSSAPLPHLPPIASQQQLTGQQHIDPSQINSPLRIFPPPAFRSVARTGLRAGGEGRTPGANLRDYETLALACQRAGRPHAAGIGFYNQAVINDNARQYRQAIQSYKRFLAAVARSGDAVGEALACNSLGVDFQLLGGEKNILAAIKYHARHLEIASQISDEAGKIAACFNLGLAYDGTGDVEQAVIHHQYALQFAIRIGDLVGEVLACAQLGHIACREGDFGAARSFLERQLHLSQVLRDKRSKAVAWMSLGNLEDREANHKEAAKCFEKALLLSRRAGDDVLAKQAECALGVAKGSGRVEEVYRTLAFQLEQDPSLDL